MCTAMLSGSVHVIVTHVHGVLTCVQVLNVCWPFMRVGMLYVDKLTSATYVLSALGHLYVGATYGHCSVVPLVHVTLV